jgi:hypothetical protein
MEVVNLEIKIHSNIYVEQVPVSIPYRELNPDLPSVDIRNVFPSRRVEDTLTDGNYINIPREKYPYLIEEQYLEKGVSSIVDCKLLELKEVSIEKKEIEPIVNAGFYVYGEEKRYLYPDSSTITTSEEVETVDAIEEHPISVAIFKRNSRLEPIIHRESFQVYDEEWLGDLEAEGRSDVSSSSLDQFSVSLEDGEITFNKVIEEAVPMNVDLLDPTLEYPIFSEYLDFVGISDGQGCQGFYTKYFPISKRKETQTQLLMYVFPPGMTEETPLSEAEIWYPTDDLREHDSASKVFYADYDLGFLHIGGLLGENDTLLATLYPDEMLTWDYISIVNPERHPDKGLIFIDTLRIFFKGKIGHRLLIEKIEGTTEADSFPAGTEVKYSYTGMVPEAGSLCYVSYVAIPRIEYVDKKYINAKCSRPGSYKSKVYLKNNESILVIGKDVDQGMSITLEAMNIDSISLSGTMYYGPLSYDENTVLLRGRVLDASGNPVIEAEVEIFSINGLGNFYGEDSITVFTDDEGYFYTSMYIDSSELFQASYARTIDFEQDLEGNWRSYLDFNYPETAYGVPSRLEEIQLYTVSKDDGLTGTVGRYHFIPIEEYSDYPFVRSILGKDYYPYDVATVNETIGSGYLSELGTRASALIIINQFENIDPTFYEDGTLYVAVSGSPYIDGTESTVIKKRKILKVLKYPKLWDSEPTAVGNSTRMSTYLIILDQRVTPPSGYVRDCWFVSKDEVQWDQEKLGGRKTVIKVLQNKTQDDIEDFIVDESESTWLNPQAPFPSEYTFVPVTPAEWLGGNKFRFTGKLPTCEVANRRVNLGAYAVYLDKVAEVQARVKDKYCVGKYYNSNIVRIIFTASGKGKGTHRVNENYVVPYGFRLPDTYEYSSLLDGPVYLTLNWTGTRSNSGFSVESSLSIPKISFINSEEDIQYEDSEINPYNNYIGYHLTITNS